MEILKNFKREDEEKTVDYFIRTKVDDLIERSVQEGKKRKNIETKVSDECSDVSTEEGFEYLTSISDFSAFPRYMGRGFQENAPDLNGSLIKKGEATLVLWYADVTEAEVKEFMAAIAENGFQKKGEDFIKKVDSATYTMSVTSASGKLRIFHKIKNDK